MAEETEITGNVADDIFCLSWLKQVRVDDIEQEEKASSYFSMVGFLGQSLGDQPLMLALCPSPCGDPCRHHDLCIC